MSYTITITKEDPKTEIKRGEYCITSWSYISEAEYDQLSSDQQKNWKKDEGNQYGKPNYGYAPPVETVTVVDKKIFEATVDLLDVNAVIMAIIDTKMKVKA